MPSTDHNTPGTKSGRRSRKASSRNPKQELPQNPEADQVQAAEPPIDIAAAAADEETVEAATAVAASEATAGPAEVSLAEAVMAIEPAPIEVAVAADMAPIESDAAPAEVDTSSDMDAPAEPAPVSLQTIAKAYGDYTRKSIEETRSYVEKLRDVRSLDKAMEVQTEFAKQAFEMFVAGSQRIYGLHKELAKQTLRPLQRLVDKPARDRR
jgi:phasin family protein